MTEKIQKKRREAEFLMMSTKLEGGGGGTELSFLSTHRCPEVDRLPHHTPESRSTLLHTLVPTTTNQLPGRQEDKEDIYKVEGQEDKEKVYQSEQGHSTEEAAVRSDAHRRFKSKRKVDFTSRVPFEANYLDVYSSCCSSSRPSEEEEEEEEEEEGSISDWSEEDLSLHFSPSVILPSEEEESDTESGFECVDITMENQLSNHGLAIGSSRSAFLKYLPMINK